MPYFQGWKVLVSAMRQEETNRNMKSPNRYETGKIPRMHQANGMHTFEVWGGDLTFGTLPMHGTSRKASHYRIQTRLESISLCREGEKDRRTS